MSTWMSDAGSDQTSVTEQFPSPASAPAGEAEAMPPAPPRPVIPLDVRPRQNRTDGGIWAKVAAARDDIFGAMHQVCVDEGRDALITKSNQLEQPAWVRIEAWVPTGENAVSGRSAATVYVHAKEFRRYDLEYTVVLDHLETHRRWGHLKAMETRDAATIARYVLGLGPAPELQFLQLRAAPWEFWKDDNPVPSLRRDWIGNLRAYGPLAALVLVALGFTSPVFFALAGVMLAASLALPHLVARPAHVLAPSRPLTEPRELELVDSWHDLVAGRGGDADALRQDLLRRARTSSIPELRVDVEHTTGLGVEVVEEDEHIVLSLRRALVFVRLVPSDDDLYVEWHGYSNCGAWLEKAVESGVSQSTGQPVKVMELVAGIEPLTDRDTADLNLLTGWTRRQIGDVLTPELHPNT